MWKRREWAVGSVNVRSGPARRPVGDCKRGPYQRKATTPTGLWETRNMGEKPAHSSQKRVDLSTTIHPEKDGFSQGALHRSTDFR